jgi:GTP-binding protein
VIADVGLAGMPNAGKSTLLAKLTHARPRVGDYAFTTLTPNLGRVFVEEEWGPSYVIADIPGLIEGASIGKGLGHQFLKHLERTKVLAYVIDGFSNEESDPFEDFITLRGEIESYSDELAERPSLVILTKADLKAGDENWVTRFKEEGIAAIEVSQNDPESLQKLKIEILDVIRGLKPTRTEDKPVSIIDEYGDYEFITS